MKKLLTYITAFLMVVMGISCTDQLRIDERQVTHDVKYFTYSRYQLTTAIVNVAKNYGKSVTNERAGQTTQYFMDCYGSDRVTDFYTTYQQNWDMEEASNPYTNEFRTLAAITTLATDEGNLATVAAADILKCVLGAYLTEKYGDIPFSDAVQGRTGNLFPKYDTQKEVYESIFVMLDNAVATLSDTNSEGLPSNHDVLFAGDRTKWIKFANSLKFRLMAHSYEAFKKAGKDLAADMQAIASSNNFMSSVADNASLAFSGLNQDEAWYLQTKWGTGNDFTEQKPTKYLIDQMVALDDPRMYVIFAPALSPLSNKPDTIAEDIKINGYTYNVTYYPVSDPKVQPNWLTATGRDANGNPVEVPYILDTQWFGTPTPITVHNIYGGVGLPGSNGTYDNRRITGFSKLIAQVSDARLKAVIMESSEMMFLLAEARQKGWISAGTVKDYYENGIKLSFARWQVVDGTKPASHLGSNQIVDNYNAYCAKAGVVLDGSAADLDKIALQKWLSMLVTNHAEAYTDIRRTGKPEFVVNIAPSFAAYDYPWRNIYPLDESSNNKDNYNAAVTALGGKDLASAKLWIHK